MKSPNIYKFKNGSGREVPVIVYFPNTYSASKKYRTVVFLHGLGEGTDNPNDVSKFTRSTYHKGLIDNGDANDYILVCPIFVPAANYIIENGAVKQTWWPNFEGGYYIRDVFNWMDANLPIDWSQLILTGFSSGANGTEDSISQPLTSSRIKKAIVVSGGKVERGDYNLVKTNKIAVWFFHGANDGGATPLSAAEQNLDMLNNKIGVDPKAILTVLPNTAHTDAPGKVYTRPDLYQWMFSGVVEPEPEPVKKVLAKLFVSSLEVTVFDDKTAEVKDVPL